MCRKSIFTWKSLGISRISIRNIFPIETNPSSFHRPFPSIFFHFSLAKSLRNMMGLLLFYITATCTITIAFNLFVVELNDALSFETTIAIVDLYLILGLTFAYYFLADWITSDLLMIGDVFYNSRWYRLPPKQQKLLIFPIRRAQRVLRLKSLGIVDCSLPVFASVRILFHF